MATKKKSANSAGTLKAFLIELVIYGVLVVAYFFCVLHFLSNWINHLEHEHIKIYALVAIALIIGQAVLLEGFTTWLMRMLQGGRSE
jgi:hypothetical protein